MASAFTYPSSVLSTTIGLANLGNTCFLNAVLQALRFSPPVGEIFLNPAIKNIVKRPESRKKDMAAAFHTLMRDFWGTPLPAGACPTLIPRGFMHHMLQQLRENAEHWYYPGQQADAAEALQYIMDSLHDAMYRPRRMEIVGTEDDPTSDELSQQKAVESWITFFGKEYSPIVQNFNGQTQIFITCSECGNKSERYEPWLMIKAPIPGAETRGAEAPTMTDCIAAGFAPETIADYACDKCKKNTKATIRTRISRLPPVTILTLKRFTNAGSKIHGKITWNLDALDFSPWMAFARDPFSDTPTFPIYETFATIEHLGGARGGHYRMYAKQNGAWMEYDDSSVRPAHPDRIVDDNTYILFLMPKRDRAAMNIDFAKRIEILQQHNAGAQAAPPASGGAGHAEEA